MRKQRLLLMFFSAVLLLCWSAALSWAFTLPDTGQTKCYDTAAKEIACAGTGQDGVYTGNTMSYTDNGDGTITDNVTKLMWQKEGSSTKMTWTETYCNSLTLGGQSGWRLPTASELITIVDYGIPYPGPTINMTYFPNTYAGTESYWTSPQITVTGINKDNVLNVYFSNGLVSSNNRGGYGYARCVRGVQSSPSFTDNGNGTVTDNGTGLMWQQGEAGSMNWANALTYCEGLSLGGQSDWRLPNVKELESIIDNTKYKPAIDTAYFPNVVAATYWSSTTDAYFDSRYDAWNVSMSGGSVVNAGFIGDYAKTNSHYVRCVRGGQAVSSTQSACAASVFTRDSSDIYVHIPILTYSGVNYWADLRYDSSNSQLTISQDYVGVVSDASSYSNCTASTLSSDLKLHIPVVMISGVSYWVDCQYKRSMMGWHIFGITGAGAN